MRWLQEGGATVPSVGTRGASALAHTARGANRAGGLKGALGKTPLWPAVQLERVHQTFLKMNRSGVVFVAALNGSALGLGAEFSWANDIRVMSNGDYFIGQPEVLLGIIPGGGGTQRLPRLVGNHKALVAILSGKPFTPAEALEFGAVDDVVAPDQVLARAIELAEYLGSRPKPSRAAIKRAVYFGGSSPLEDGLHIERSEFLATALSSIGQELMLDYMANTDAAGELPLYQPGVYEQVLQTGNTRGAGATEVAR
ncbi:MAG: enoyl-CoA hydratase/isomerase family protein [Gordonia sp. (in: high G+C Gram-positive bacteria)]|uniref:enoyl-CoA hydratase/isomerase family protein n=1 Tax=Gordonia sp. (in: high G+C Gram-positive bacteria) TaxID=84139 RepID=UPI003BB5E7C0